MKRTVQQNCKDFRFKNPLPEFRCKKGHYCMPGVCVICANIYDQTNESLKYRCEGCEITECSTKNDPIECLLNKTNESKVKTNGKL